MTDRDQLRKVTQWLISHSPGFAALVMHCPVVLSDDTQRIAWTNGDSITYGKRFFTLPPPQQAAVVVHEVLHVALRHIPRLKARRLDREVWNLATDAIINGAIAQGQGLKELQLPPNHITLGTLLDKQTLANKPLPTWSAESLYDWLLEHAVKVECPMPDLKPEGNSGGDRDGEGKGDPLSEGIWEKRWMRAVQGDAPGGLLRSIENAYAPSVIDWRAVLRRYLLRHVKGNRVANWSRGSRRCASLGSAFWEPGSKPPLGIQTAGIVIDTSGSIDGELLTAFASEVQSIQRAVGCDLRLICADAKVQSDILLKNTGETFTQRVASGKITFKGGGGTDFEPALKALATGQKVQVVVYLTDMYGNFGPNVRYTYPLLWASITKEMTAPFGQTLYIGK